MGRNVRGAKPERRESRGGRPRSTLVVWLESRVPRSMAVIDEIGGRGVGPTDPGPSIGETSAELPVAIAGKAVCSYLVKLTDSA